MKFQHRYGYIHMCMNKLQHTTNNINTLHMSSWAHDGKNEMIKMNKWKLLRIRNLHKMINIMVFNWKLILNYGVCGFTSYYFIINFHLFHSYAIRLFTRSIIHSFIDSLIQCTFVWLLLLLFLHNINLNNDEEVKSSESDPQKY